jgi:hypothetical protein
MGAEKLFELYELRYCGTLKDNIIIELSEINCWN